MPANFVLLEKITVGAAGASSVTFSGIPQTGYTDLVLKISARTTRAHIVDAISLSFNGVATNQTSIYLEGNGGSANSNSLASFRTLANGANSTSSTFGNSEYYIPNYTGSTFKSASSDGVAENNASDGYGWLVANLWSSTAAITSITVTDVNSATFVANSTFYLYGVAALGTTPVIVPYATGGDTIMTDGTYWYHTFISSGTFTPAKALSVDYLVVAGGAGGGGNIGGGGGAGGFRTSTGFSCLSSVGLTVTVGAGGASSSNLSASGGAGSNSVFSTITSAGGGGGGGDHYNGQAGGSGGGEGNRTSSVGGLGNTPSTSPSQGNNGGYATGTSKAGGGGASAVGANGGATPGAGGAGTSNSYSGSAVTYAGGGGGGYYSGVVAQGLGGAGGGGNGGMNDGATLVFTATAGTANTGGGGGGGGWGGGSPANGASGAGGSGIVLVRYAV